VGKQDHVLVISVREKNQPRARMPFPEFSAHGQRAEDIPQRTRPANDDQLFAKLPVLVFEPPPKNDWVRNPVYGRAKVFPDGPGKLKRRAGLR
jgi:hypothetical protein